MCEVCVASKILAKENKHGVWLGWPEGYGLFVKARADGPEFKPGEAFVRKTDKENWLGPFVFSDLAGFAMFLRLDIKFKFVKEKHEGEWSPIYKYLQGWGEPTDLLDAWKRSELT